MAATIVVLNDGVGRAILAVVAPPVRAGEVLPTPPMPATLLGAALSDLFSVVVMSYDRRTRGSIHPVYWWSGAAFVAAQILRVPLSQTEAWHGLLQILMGAPG